MNVTKITILTALLATSLVLSSCTTPPWAFEAEKIAQVALPIVEGLAGILGGSAAVTRAENDINLLITLFDKYRATPAAGTLQQIQVGLATTNADIAQILPATGVKNSGTAGKVAAVLQLVTSEFGAIASLMPTEGTPTTTPSAGKRADTSQPTADRNVTAKTPAALSAKEFKYKYNEIVKSNPEFRRL